MPRLCTVCGHQDRASIDQALVTGEANRRIATRHGLSEAAVRRHAGEHLPAHLAQAEDAKQATEAGDLLGQVRALQARAVAILDKAERAGDYRTALAGIREARGCLELLLEVSGELDRRPVNVLVSPEWLQTRAIIVQALVAYPEARLAVADELARLEQAS